MLEVFYKILIKQTVKMRPKSDQKSFSVLNRLKYTGFKRFKAGMIWDYKVLLDVL
jgi:hypothetical protein